MTHYSQRPLTRREALFVMGSGLVTVASCGSDAIAGSADWTNGRIRARPASPSAVPPTGVTAIPASVGVNGIIFVPASYTPGTPAPVAVLLHGAGRDASELIVPLSTYAESRGLVLVAVTATQRTWDAIHGAFGPDVRNIDRALAWLFDRISVDVARLGVIGFSDGATYAIALSRVNGDLFRRVNVYSPGFLIPVDAVGKPEFFITHGTQDQVLSIETTRSVIVPTLRAAGYSVEFYEWSGGHGVSAALLEESVQWFVRA